MKRQPVHPYTVALCTPAAHMAVDKALHASDPAAFHKRHGALGCPWCGGVEGMLAKFVLEELESE